MSSTAFYWVSEGGQDVTWSAYDGPTVTRDFTQAKAFGFDTMRTGMGTAVFGWPTLSTRVLSSGMTAIEELDDMADRAQALGMRLMLTMFAPDWGFFTSVGRSIAYLQSILTPARLDPTKIAIVELINECPWLGAPCGGIPIASSSWGVDVSSFTAARLGVLNLATPNPSTARFYLGPGATITVGTSRGEATMSCTGSNGTNQLTGLVLVSGSGTITTTGRAWTHSPADAQTWALALLPHLKSACEGTGIVTTMSAAQFTSDQGLAQFAQMVTTLREASVEPDHYRYHSYSIPTLFAAELATVVARAAPVPVRIGEYGHPSFNFATAYGVTPVNGSGVTLPGSGAFTFVLLQNIPVYIPHTGSFQVVAAGGGSTITINYTGWSAATFSGCTSAAGTVYTAGATRTSSPASILGWNVVTEGAQADYIHQIRYLSHQLGLGEPDLWQLNDQDDVIVSLLPAGSDSHLGIMASPGGGVQPPSGLGNVKAAGSQYLAFPAGAAPPPPSLNGGFEASWTCSDGSVIPRRWAPYHGRGGEYPIVVSLDSTVRHSGTKSLKITGCRGYTTGNPPAAQGNPSPFVLAIVPTEDYTFSVWMSASPGGSGTDIAQLFVAWFDVTGVYLSTTQSALFTPADSWTQYDCPPATAPTAAAFAQIGVRIVNQMAAVWLDDATWTGPGGTDK